MPPYKQVFWGILFFLAGVFAVSFYVGFSLLLLWGVLFLALLLFFRGKKEALVLFLLSLLFFLGAFYSFFYDTLTRPAQIPFGEKVLLTGTLHDAQEKPTYQTAVFIDQKSKLKIFVLLGKEHIFYDGDVVTLFGTLEAPAAAFGKYLFVKNIFATMNFPETKILTTGSSVSVFTRIHNAVVTSFTKAFPPREAALASGLVLGETSGFSETFRAAMQRSGTTHIVALSGYNVMIIVSSLLALFPFFVRRHLARFFAFFALFIFILIAGPQASVVRAAIMAALFLFLKISGRLTDPKNVIAATAFLMVLENPRILAFDVGFQLSFLAFIGIVFLSPLFAGFFHKKDRPRPLWHGAVFSTLAAQIMALPVLLFYFQEVFVSSIFANVLIVTLVPLAMAFSFFTAFAAFLFFPLSQLFAWFSYPILRLVTGIVEFFSRFAFVPLRGSVAFVGIVLYYSVVLVFIYYYGTAKRVF